MEWGEFKVRKCKINNKKGKKKCGIVKKKAKRKKGQEKVDVLIFIYLFLFILFYPFFFFFMLAAICEASCISANGTLPTRNDDCSLLECPLLLFVCNISFFFFPIRSFPFIPSENFLQLRLFWRFFFFSFPFSLFELSGQFYFLKFSFIVFLIFSY